jgi:hypothetical protein
MLDAIARVLDPDLKAKPTEGVVGRSRPAPKVIMSRAFMAQNPRFVGTSVQHVPRHMIPGADGGSRSIFAVQDTPTTDEKVEPDYRYDVTTGTLTKVWP